MHGAGNDYIYIDVRQRVIDDPARLAVLWSDRHMGIGGDGIVLIGASDVADFSMRIFNADGSEGLMCGNATRCIAKYVHDKGLTQSTEISLETASGIKMLRAVLDAQGRVQTVTTDMGEPSLTSERMLNVEGGRLLEGVVMGRSGRKLRGTFVSMGNPHFVVFCEDVEHFDVAGIGPDFEHASAFPERCNVEFASIMADGTIRMRVWERGSGITLACGTGACATAVAAVVTGRSERKCRVVMDGGVLEICLDERTNHVLMTGPAAFVFDGVAELPESLI